ncbi:hypothetical protein ABW19_dt0209369 [Dactylella cylindrospora]|nr:hypothetical protein ABW19_dt0209369 [Dactylella cylindrospora]
MYSALPTKSPTTPPGIPAPAGINQTPLTFPAPLFRQISPTLYLQRHLLDKSSTRPNGRHPSQYRDFTLTTNSLTHAHGSAVVRAGDTAVVCGVRGEVLTIAPGDDPLSFESYATSSDSATHAYGGHGRGGASWGGLIVPNVELSTGCSKKFPLGAPGELAQALSDQILECINVSKLVDLQSLRILDREGGQVESQKIKGYWVLYVDLSCISLDGNLLDAAWYALVAALATTKLPLANWNQNEERIFCDRLLHHPLVIRKNLPFIVSFALVQTPQSTSVDSVEALTSVTEGLTILTDPDSFEEEEANGNLILLATSATMAPSKRATSDGKMLQIERMEKIGGGKLGISHIDECVSMAIDKLAQYSRILHDSIAVGALN